MKIEYALWTIFLIISILLFPFLYPVSLFSMISFSLNSAFGWILAILILLSWSSTIISAMIPWDSTIISEMWTILLIISILLFPFLYPTSFYSASFLSISASGYILVILILLSWGSTIIIPFFFCFPPNDDDL
jgi:hypothetical protein